MLTRISLIVAIVAGLAVAGVNFVEVKKVITTLITERDSEKGQKEAAQTELSSTKRDLAVNKQMLESTKTELADTQDQRDKAITEKENETKHAAKLAEDLAKAVLERNDAQDTVARWNVLGVTPDQVKVLIAERNQFKDECTALQETNQLHLAKINTLKNRLAKYEDENYHVELPETLHGKVLVADPKWDFVVLDFGEKQGALEDGVLLVNRNGRLVAKVQIKGVRPDRCIANVLPKWKLGDVMEGDLVFP